MEPLVLARNAMRTRFELVLPGDDPVGLRAAGEEALDEIERVERAISAYRPSSELSQLNRHAAAARVLATPELIDLLHTARALTSETGGAFDITVGPLLRCWGFAGGTGSKPGEDEIAAALEFTGMHWVQTEDYFVRFGKQGVALDMGGIGKGWAIDAAIQSLRGNGIRSALLHGGTSTAYALGTGPEGEPWKVAIDPPPPEWLGIGPLPQAIPPLAVVSLRDQAISVSAPSGKSFTEAGVGYGHVLDPRTGRAVLGHLLAGIVHPSATTADAWSTALLVLGSEGIELLTTGQPEARGLFLARRPEGTELELVLRRMAGSVTEFWQTRLRITDSPGA